MLDTTEIKREGLIDIKQTQNAAYVIGKFYV